MPLVKLEIPYMTQQWHMRDYELSRWHIRKLPFLYLTMWRNIDFLCYLEAQICRNCREGHPKHLENRQRSNYWIRDGSIVSNGIVWIWDASFLYWVMIIERVLDVKLRKRTGYGAKGSLIDLILNLYELRLQIAGTIMAPVHDFFGSLSLCPKGIFTLALYLSAFELELPAQTNLANITNHFYTGICRRRAHAYLRKIIK